MWKEIFRWRHDMFKIYCYLWSLDQLWEKDMRFTFLNILLVCPECFGIFYECEFQLSVIYIYSSFIVSREIFFWLNDEVGNAWKNVSCNIYCFRVVHLYLQCVPYKAASLKMLFLKKNFKLWSIEIMFLNASTIWW